MIDELATLNKSRELFAAGDESDTSPVRLPNGVPEHPHWHQLQKCRLPAGTHAMTDRTDSQMRSRLESARISYSRFQPRTSRLKSSGCSILSCEESSSSNCTSTAQRTTPRLANGSVEKAGL